MTLRINVSLSTPDTNISYKTYSIRADWKIINVRTTEHFRNILSVSRASTRLSSFQTNLNHLN